MLPCITSGCIRQLQIIFIAERLEHKSDSFSERMIYKAHVNLKLDLHTGGTSKNTEQPLKRFAGDGCEENIDCSASSI